MAEPMDIVAWAEANLKRPADAEGFRPTEFQRRIAEVMREPGVRVVIRHQYRNRRSLEMYALMALALAPLRDTDKGDDE